MGFWHFHAEDAPEAQHNAIAQYSALLFVHIFLFLIVSAIITNKLKCHTNFHQFVLFVLLLLLTLTAWMLRGCNLNIRHRTLCAWCLSPSRLPICSFYWALAFIFVHSVPHRCLRCVFYALKINNLMKHAIFPVGRRYHFFSTSFHPFIQKAQQKSTKLNKNEWKTVYMLYSGSSSFSCCVARFFRFVFAQNQDQVQLNWELCFCYAFSIFY